MNKGQLSVIRRDRDTIIIELEDGKSGTRCAYVEISMQNMMLALTGLSSLPCFFELAPQYVGKKHEVKTEEVPWDRGVTQSPGDAIKVFEVDGWTGYCGDIGNHHKLVRREDGIEVYRMTYTRFVEDK